MEDLELRQVEYPVPAEMAFLDRLSMASQGKTISFLQGSSLTAEGINVFKLRRNSGI